MSKKGFALSEPMLTILLWVFIFFIGAVVIIGILYATIPEFKIFVSNLLWKFVSMLFGIAG